MKYLITGGCGFIGSNLSAELIKRGEELIVFDNLSRFGSEKNYQWLLSKGEFIFYQGDIRIQNDIERIISEHKPNVIFHLSGQVAMTTSISNPRLDFETNVIGTFNLLEAVRRHSERSIVLYSSTNKVYGDFHELNFEETDTRYICVDYPAGIPEEYPLNFHSPYGCSKGAADQYILDFSRIYGLRTAVFRHSSMYGGNQHATFDQGWIGWFCQKAIEANRSSSNSFTISGSGKQVRDVLHAKDVVDLYFKASENIDKIKGEAFNIGGGIENSLSLLELFQLLEEHQNIKLKYERLPWRESDQKVFIADNSKILKILDWAPKQDKHEGIIGMLEWLKSDAI
jgi:CDP-paratose 2-epimerase